MPNETLTESRRSPALPLTSAEAAALESLGRRLAGQRAWWGTANDTDAPERSVISCHPTADGQYQVQVRDVIGVVAVGDWQLQITPKIPLDHALFLLERADVLPRLDPTSAVLDPDESFWSVIARWYVDALRRLLRADLIRDYREQSDSLPFVRGRLRLLDTTHRLQQGRLELHCDFEEFDADNPLNRLLKAAARSVAGSARLDPRGLRREAARSVSAMVDVGPPSWGRGRYH